MPRAQTLGGAVLGYVPRELTRRFQHETSFAHVYGIGVAADAGLYGAQVSFAGRACEFQRCEKQQRQFALGPLTCKGRS